MVKKYNNNIIKVTYSKLGFVVIDVIVLLLFVVVVLLLFVVVLLLQPNLIQTLKGYA